MNATDSSGSSWSNIPRCLNTVQTTSMLSSDAGISSMPSSMISNISETEHHTLTNFNSLQHQEIIIRNNFTENISVEQPPMVLAPDSLAVAPQYRVCAPGGLGFCFETPILVERRTT